MVAQLSPLLRYGGGWWGLLARGWGLKSGPSATLGMTSRSLSLLARCNLALTKDDKVESRGSLR